MYMENTTMTKYHRQVRRILPDTHWLAPHTTPSFRKLLVISSTVPWYDRASGGYSGAYGEGSIVRLIGL